MTVETIHAKLVQRATLSRWKAIAGVVFGLPFSLLGPLVLGSMFWIATGFLFDRWYPWWWYFVGFSVLTLPLLFHLELKTGGDYMGSVAREPGLQAEGGDTLTIAAHMRFGALAGVAVSAAMNPRMTSAGLTEFFLFGPRLVVGGRRTLRLSRQLAAVDIQRAAELVARLLSVTQGVAHTELLTGGEKKTDLVPVLCWLAVNGWIGVSEKNDRAFLFSESREKLLST